MARCIARTSQHRRGITLIEMLIAIAISLVVMLAVIQVFDQLNSAMTNSKSAIEQAGELRNVTQRLQADLDGRTALTLAWTPADAGDGYFEYLESIASDKDYNFDGTDDPTVFWGDLGDVLMFTSRSSGKPFVGRYDPDGPTGPQPVELIESELAEIIWWTEQLADQNGNGIADPAEIVLRRRALLIRPDLEPSVTSAEAFFNDSDVSVREEGGTLVANSLADLTLRQNRVFHTNDQLIPADIGKFPYAMNTDKLLAISGTDDGIDLVLDKVVAFDVRVYDPMAPLRAGNGVALAPGDPGWAAATTAGATIVGRGAYVDLNYHNVATTSFFSGPANNVSRATTPHTLPRTYSTWPEAYEHDGVNQDGDVDTATSLPLIDEGRDGFNTGTGPTAADDPGETETFPPYPHPITGQKFPGLRGVQVRIRLVEPSSRQVRQATVVSDFVPE